MKNVRYNVTIHRRKGVSRVLKKLIELFLENLSTKDVFLFRIACSACGAEFANKPHRFSKAGIAPQTEEKKIIFHALYEQEFQGARQAAIREASEHINYCPICKRLICNRCFLICEDLDMCSSCATRLKETGIPVDSDALESAV